MNELQEESERNPKDYECKELQVNELQDESERNPKDYECKELQWPRERAPRDKSRNSK